MEPQKFWAELFRGRVIEGRSSSRSENAALLMVAAHREQYGDHLGPARISWNDQGCLGTFPRCEQGDRAGICDAHQGFLKGTLEGLGFKDVRIGRSYDDSVCRLRIQWEKP